MHTHWAKKKKPVLVPVKKKKGHLMPGILQSLSPLKCLHLILMIHSSIHPDIKCSSALILSLSPFWKSISGPFPLPPLTLIYHSYFSLHCLSFIIVLWPWCVPYYYASLSYRPVIGQLHFLQDNENLSIYCTSLPHLVCRTATACNVTRYEVGAPPMHGVRCDTQNYFQYW